MNWGFASTWVSGLPRSTTTSIHPFVQYAKVTLLEISPWQCPIVKRSGVAYSCSYELLLSLVTRTVRIRYPEWHRMFVLWKSEKKPWYFHSIARQLVTSRAGKGALLEVQVISRGHIKGLPFSTQPSPLSLSPTPSPTPSNACFWSRYVLLSAGHWDTFETTTTS